MNKWIKNILKTIISIVLVALLILGGIIGHAFVTMYRPAPVEQLRIHTTGINTDIAMDTPYTLTTFNTGYAGLGKEQDFFMDGGVNSGASSLEEVETNLQAITTYIFDTNADFVLLQEVDEKGKRSYNVDQISPYKGSDYSYSFAKNFDTAFVPIPFTDPMGGGISGIMTLSKAIPNHADRYSLDGKEPFVKQLFDLKRAFTITRYTLDNGKEFVLLNTHFSAFDKGGQVRVKQLAQVNKILVEEQKKGNYVILGGDFNHELPGTSSDNFTWTEEYPDWCFELPDDFTPTGYSWATDGSMPSIRANNIRYTQGKNFVAVIDGFIVSDNISIENVKTVGELNFEHSDHNPVEMTFVLKD